MKLKLALCLMMSIPLAGCFMAQKSTVIPSKQYFDKESQARIRLFGPYGNPTIKHYVGKTCEDWRSTMGKKIHHRVNNGLPRRIKNISLDMPITKRSDSASNDKGIMFRDSFKEYAIDAGQPVTLDGSVSVQLDNYSSACRVAVSFTPIAGKDYEAYYIENNKSCTIAIREIQNDVDENNLAKTTEVKDVKGCSALGDRKF